MMTIDFNFNIVLLSFGVCFIAIYITVSSAEQFRGVFLKNGKPSFLQKLPWLSAIGISVAFAGLGGMHYISLSGLTLRDDQGQVVPIHFNVGISLLSVLLGFLFKTTGILIACSDRFYAKSKEEILDFFVKERSIEEILTYSESKVTYLLISKELTYSLLGGTCTAIGVIVFHFVSMSAVEFPGYITYNGGIIFAALIFCFSAVLTAYWLFFRLLSIFPNAELFRLFVALSGAISIASIHYIALIGTNFHIDYSRSTESTWKAGSMTQEDSLYPVLLACIILLWILAMLIFAELRGKINSYRAYMQKLAPNEKISDLLLAAENSFNEDEGNRRQQLKMNSVAPFDDESPI